ncbi:MAG: NAD(P)H-dependent oxidoreductase subunit E [Pseudomonadaceae bacterium]|nr:NAD(P)H-dependent oxidoreductase subunit E [Pseudomonadaceae bacterium]
MPTIRIDDTAAVGQTPKPLGLDLAWSKQAKAAIKDILARYPKERSRSATIPLLHLAQREFGGWLSVDAMQLVADTLNLPYIRVYEVATFYTMFNLKPVGKYHVQVCTNCACMVRGSDAIVQAVKEQAKIGELDDHHQGHSPCGTFTLTEVECLGACVGAPMMQVTAQNGASHYYTKLDAKQTKQILKDLKSKGVSELVDTPPADVDPISGGGYTS